jgi:hypothetical protein
VKIFSPVLPLSIIFHSSHPLNVYHSFIGFFSTTKSFTVYVDGLIVSLFDPSTPTYVIVYDAAAFQIAVRVIFS